MKSLKIAFHGVSYPLFFGDEAREKFSDLTSLYRFPQTGFLISRKSQKIAPLASGIKLQKLSAPRKTNLSGFGSLEKIISLLPWKKLETPVSLVVFGDDLFLNLVSFAARLIESGPTVIWIPTSIWAMIECGVRSHAFLAWDDRALALSTPASPNMVVLDLNCLELKNDNELLALRIGILRNLLLTDRIRFSHFESHWKDLTLSDSTGIYAALESVLTTRMAIFEKGSQGRYLLYDFGLRALNQSRIKEPPGPEKLPLLVLIEIAWRLKLARRLSIGDPGELGRIDRLIEEMKAASSLKESDWSAATILFQEFLETSMLTNIHLPAGIGNLQKIKAVDKKDAMACL